MATINLNARARVTLTRKGAEIYNNWLYAIETWSKPEEKKTGDVLETQLWELFQIFGNWVYMGMPEVPFVDNKIELEEMP